ncbi:hypothetical protein AGR56_18310 [Clostridium sp. DMHC 10]|uniref:hypothetical protein n=1 Tax=Clostridium sp. DMHC 10 TaxID=747377 RepID=UPI00069DAD98|nr:hypothetical protein [Clostridium sp. DMHC 10]KOF55766.1 hypothetical protein AGR56_18310 [Clostridium sp. DMHC 10]
MDSEEKVFFKSLCKLCISNYQILNSANLVSALISQISRVRGIDVPVIEGILYVEIKNHKRNYAHCFNMYKGQVIDATIYSHALLNKNFEGLFPLYVVGNEPGHIEYSVISEVYLDSQFKFKEDFLNDVICKVNNYKDTEIKRFDEVEDNRKKNLFYYK